MDLLYIYYVTLYYVILIKLKYKCIYIYIAILYYVMLYFMNIYIYQ